MQQARHWTVATISVLFFLILGAILYFTVRPSIISVEPLGIAEQRVARDQFGAGDAVGGGGGGVGSERGQDGGREQEERQAGRSWAHGNLTGLW